MTRQQKIDQATAERDARQFDYDNALAALNLAQAALDDAIVNAVDDPPPPAPSNFRVSGYYYMGDRNPLAIEFAWDAQPGYGTRFDYIGEPENAAGPQSWTPVTINGDGASATHILQNPAGQRLIFVLQHTGPDGDGPNAEIRFNTDTDAP